MCNVYPSSAVTGIHALPAKPPTPPPSPCAVSPPGAPASGLFVIRQTLHAGRGVFASESIEEGALLWTTSKPAASLIVREYRKEVCVQCFAYNDGREWKIRDRSVGFAFCSPECQQAWQAELGDVGVAAWQAVEALIRSRKVQDELMDDLDAPKPTKSEIAAAWRGAEARAENIRRARQGSKAKTHRREMRAALHAAPAPDTLSFLLSGVLLRCSAPEAWGSVNALASNPRPYRSALDLQMHLRSYHQLLAVVPADLLPHVTHETCVILVSRDSHNSFGIRSLDDGSEYMGYGVWPSASYFNHSCDPNVGKRRAGRMWEFRAQREISKGEELCITYQSDEDKLSRGQRLELLKKNWGFTCNCERCRED